MSYEQLRKGRVSITGQAYLLTTVTAKREPIFSSLYLGRLVVSELQKLDRVGATKTLAYVLMPDHLHWLCQLQEVWTLPTVMRRLTRW